MKFDEAQARESGTQAEGSGQYSLKYAVGADDCMDAGGRATQEQLPTTAWMQEVEQRRSSCRGQHGDN